MKIYNSEEEYVNENALGVITKAFADLGVITSKGEPGKDYILTEDDKSEIAKMVEVPVVEKVTEIIKEIPIITEITKNEIKEVAITESPEVIASKLNTLKEVIDVSVIKGIKELQEDNKKFGEGMQKVDGRLKLIDQRYHGGGLSKVSTDNTLSGLGTPSSPLTVNGVPTLAGDNTFTGTNTFDGVVDLSDATVWYTPEEAPNATYKPRAWFKSDTLTSNGLLASWTDSSGNGQNAVQANASLQPTAVAGQYARFGILDVMASPLNLAGATSVTIIMVGRQTAGSGYRPMFRIPGSSGVFLDMITFLGKAWLESHSFYTDTPVDNVTTWHIYTIKVTPTRRSVRIDSVLQTDNFEDPPSSGIALTAPLFLGGDAASSTYSWDGDIAEFAVYDQDVPDDTIRAIEMGLRRKYNIANNPEFFFVGDSEFAGYGLADDQNPVHLFSNAVGPSRTYHTIATAGRRANTLLSVFDTAVTPYMNAVNDIPPIILIETGINDLIQGRTAVDIYADIIAICNKARVAGGICYVVTPTPSYKTGSEETERQALLVMLSNGWQGFCDGLVRIGSNSTVGDQPDTLNTTYYQADQVHWKGPLTSIIVSLYQQVVSDELIPSIETLTNLIIPTTTSTAGQVIQNGNRIMHTYGTSNIFTGKGAGNFTTSGDGKNSTYGALSGVTLSTGTDNTLIGYGADVTGGTVVGVTAIGSGATVSSSNSIAIGVSANATGIQAFNIGYNNALNADYGGILGSYNNSTGVVGFIMGNGNVISGSTQSVIIGQANSSTNGQYSTTIGGNNIGNSYQGTIVGFANTTTFAKTGELALGYGNTVTGDLAVAIGNNITNATDNSVMIGPNNTAKIIITPTATSVGTVFFPIQAITASAPTYVKGGMYFDTTLNKLRIGGATAWETVTSV